MEDKLPLSDLCTREELESLVSEVGDMQNLTGILPTLTNLKRTRSTVSLPIYPRALSPGRSKESEEKGLMTTASRKLTLELMNEDSQTNGKRYTNPRCHGSVQSSELESQM